MTEVRSLLMCQARGASRNVPPTVPIVLFAWLTATKAE